MEGKTGTIEVNGGIGDIITEEKSFNLFRGGDIRTDVKQQKQR